MTQVTVLNIEALRHKSQLSLNSGDYNPTVIRRARHILKILERDNFQCVKCGSKKRLTIDHIHPPQKTKSGYRRINTLYLLEDTRTLCKRCHEKKNFKGKWRQRRR